MDKLLSLINGMTPEERGRFSCTCKTTIGYIRKAISAGEKLNPVLCINIEAATNRQVTCEELRPDLADQWAYLRGTTTQTKEAA